MCVCVCVGGDRVVGVRYGWEDFYDFPFITSLKFELCELRPQKANKFSQEKVISLSVSLEGSE